MDYLTQHIDIGIMYGEGIGFEVMKETIKILDALSNRTNLNVHYKFGPEVRTPIKTKRGTVNPIYKFYEFAIQNNIPILSGPLSGGVVYSIRKRFDLFYKLVPIHSLSIYPNELCKKKIDILLIRQNNTGDYFGRHGFTRGKNNERIAYQNITYCDLDIIKIASVAFDQAHKRKKNLSLLVKNNGFPGISALWSEIFRSQAQNYSDVQLRVLNVDHGAAELITKPYDFDVVVTLNLDGDIISDSMVALVLGSRGMGYSGNFNGNGFGSYQTVHGGALDITGQNKANPIGQICSSAMMLTYSYGMDQESNIIKQAIADVLRRGFRTKDIYKDGYRLVNTQEMGSLIAEAIMEG